MQTNEISIQKTGLLSGMAICASLIIYFLLIRFVNLTGSAVAWGVNFIILFLGITFTFRYYRTETGQNVDYLSGMLLGTITTTVTALLFTFFIYMYFSSIDPFQLQLLRNNVLFMGAEIPPLKVAGATMIEGLCSGLILSFIMMQYFKSGFRKALKDQQIHN